MSLLFRFAVVTDEISDDLARAAAVARELGFDHVELNTLWSKNVVELSADEVDSARQVLADHGLSVAVLGTPCFKTVELDEAEPHQLGGFVPFRTQLEIVRRAIALAHEFACPFVRVFSFRKTGMVGLGNPSPRLPMGGEIPADELDKIAESLRWAGDLAMNSSVTLVVENVRSCWGNTGVNVARIVEATGHPRVRTLWDPGNDFVAGGTGLKGYHAARSRLVHVHVKDARVVEPGIGLTSWESPGDGEVEVAAHLRALVDDRYAGLVSLETHWRGDGLGAEASTRAAWAALRAIETQLA